MLPLRHRFVIAVLLAISMASMASMAWMVAGCSRRPESETKMTNRVSADTTPKQAEQKAQAPIMSTRSYVRPSNEELKKKLTAIQYRVSREDATEPPFRNEFWDNHAAGIYVDIASGEPLFSSLDKFESGTGWPSFTRPIEEGRTVTKIDREHGMVRTESRSKVGDSHLGHVFEDGPPPTGLRYCINSASLRFIPLEKLEAEGYGEYAALFAKGAKAPVAKTDNACAPGDAKMGVGDGAAGIVGASAGDKSDKSDKKGASCNATIAEVVVAGGCFWGMEELIRAIPGVIETEVGYAGGTTSNPNYEAVKGGSTGHAESVRISYDPSKLAFADLLEKWFFKMHDPTTANRQGNDVGTQYRSAIFFTTPEQKKIAEEVKAKVEASGKWKKPIVTQIVAAGPFTKAEDYHQDYLQKHPGGYSCHFMRD